MNRLIVLVVALLLISAARYAAPRISPLRTVEPAAAQVAVEAQPAASQPRSPAAPPSSSPSPTATPPPPPSSAVANLTSDLEAFGTRLLPVSEQLDAYAAALRAQKSGDWAGAVTRFANIADADSPLAATARVRQAQALVKLQRRDEAIGMFDAALANNSLPAPLARIAHQDAADALVALGRTQAAVAHLGDIIAASASTRTQTAEAQWKRAQLRRDLGDTDWTADAQAVVRSAPGTTGATAALDALERVGAGAPLGVAAYARYRARQNTEARRLYSQLVDAPASPAEAASGWFYLGALAERRLDIGTAIADYGHSLEWAPQGALAADARWWLGLLLEANGRPLEAAQQFVQLVNDFPRSGFADAAAVRAGVALAEGGASNEAAAQLRAAMASGRSRRAADAARWLQVLGLATSADASPAASDPLAFSAVAAKDGGLLTALPSAALTEWSTPPADDQVAVYAWMAATYGPRSNGGALLIDPELAQGIALAVAGEDVAGRSLLFRLIARFDRQPYELLDLARVADAVALPDVAMQASATFLNRLDTLQRLRAPITLERYAHPLAYADQAFAAARAEGVPPLLLLALVRQESAFDAAAESPAGALGLTQVVPPTGAQIAASLRMPWPADLFDPATSLRFGAHYLAVQLQRFNGNVPAALAAYNGGPGNAASWLSAQRYPGPDGYTYAVDFVETRAYIQLVVENYAWYRYLYAGR